MLVAVAAGVAAGLAGSPIQHAVRASGRTASTTAAPPPVPARTVLVAHVGAHHDLDLLAVAGIRAGGRVGSVAFLPTTTLVEVPSFEYEPVAALPKLGDTSLLETAISNALGIRFDAAIVAGDERLAQLVAPAQTLDVSFTHAVAVDDAAGTLSFAAGAARVSAGDAARLVIGPDRAGTLEHLVNVQSVLQGWLQRLKVATVARATEKVARAASILVALAHADVKYDTVPVDVLSSGSTARYELREPDAEQLVRARFPDALFTTGTRPRVEVSNGTGAVALTQAVARKLVPAGAEITLTDNVSGFGVKRTTVVYYRDADIPAAKRLVAALGVGSVARGNIALDVVDLTVVVGSDFHPD